MVSFQILPETLQAALSKVSPTLSPRLVIAVIRNTAISPTSNPYSTAVAPSSSRHFSILSISPRFSRQFFNWESVNLWEWQTSKRAHLSRIYRNWVKSPGYGKIVLRIQKILIRLKNKFGQRFQSARCSFTFGDFLALQRSRCSLLAQHRNRNS